MNKTLIARLVVGAIATIAAGSVSAGQIQASSVSIAREAITTDVQTVLAPSIAYRFAGDVDARTQAQTFQVQFTLAAGSWAAAPKAPAISVTNGVSGVIYDQSAAGYQVSNLGLSADGKTMWATINVSQGAAALIQQPIISINVTSNTINGVAATAVVVADRGTVKGLFAVVGDIVADYTATGACEGVKTLPVSFKHYVALLNPAVIATDATATADEHIRSGSTNSATLMTFPTNVKVNVATAGGGVALAPGGNMTFITAGTGAPAFIDATDALLGSVTLSQNAVGYDSNLVNQYLLAGAGAGIVPVATATTNTGVVEAKDLKVTVTGTNGFVLGGTLALNTAANCAGGTRVAGTGTVVIGAANAAGPIDRVIPTATAALAMGVSGTAPIYVCYTNPGNATIPSSQFSAVARLEKAAAGANLNEQDNVCRGNFISLGGGLKIDVRNYASSAETSGYQSVLRFINPSENKTADVWGQLIHQDGKLGGYGLLTTLAPRQILNMTAAQIDAKLTTAPTAAVGATAPAAAVAGAPRLRITSNTGDTLRVQNYMYNSATGQILEASGDQAVDFAGSVNRAPASEGQYQSQDAQSGLNLAP